MSTVTLSSKNQIVVPKEARQRLSIGPGDRLLISVKAGEVIVVTRPEEFCGELYGSGKKVFPGNHVKKERKSWK
jgi:AbrB family looped-hinge helix DNA binding protein